MEKKEAIARLEKIIENSTTHNYCELKIKANDWENYGKSRTYFSIIEQSTDSKISKHFKEKKYGYIDNNSGEYIAEKYGDLTRNHTFSGSEF